ncbi:tRNA (adenosine(37)-N6)-dimethylallyltransferase MiaA [Acidisoma silvae]|uniref:tRNA dimethylallyltransferase n=1 Tax=Acidisoma silvae TaxID=2802396 RepID=A0A963YPK2_9PROT|nr:tRNA (adenosine(37)-N6)-dimethylallyltransferase MiaA [Acidisoma silvae]MCB8874684.1 tRNA (adenosine(37)-N6)-dimethylallyltransferase MiaA [Acidisoma silvae]
MAQDFFGLDGLSGRLPLAIFVAGPTCSGKSALAMLLAERLGGVVINADSMQIYRELRILTARPSEADEAQVPHALYGARAAAEPGNVAWWREAALGEMSDAHARGLLPILCGGTGLYFSALRNGLSEIPAIDPSARAEARAALATLGPHALHAELTVRDPETAARLHPSDSQRIARAYEVLLSTGRGLASWRRHVTLPPPPWRFRAIQLDPPRAELQAVAALRFDRMLEAGAEDEVRLLAEQALDPALPAMRAHGVPELAAHLRGEMALDAARNQAVANTHHYIKRQATWFRHHELADEGHLHTIHAQIADPAQLSESGIADLTRFIREVG